VSRRHRYPDDSDGAVWTMVGMVLWMFAAFAVAIAVARWL
jgi:hypothetical protein